MQRRQADGWVTRWSSTPRGARSALSAAEQEVRAYAESIRDPRLDAARQAYMQTPEWWRHVWADDKEQHGTK